MLQVISQIRKCAAVVFALLLTISVTTSLPLFAADAAVLPAVGNGRCVSFDDLPVSPAPGQPHSWKIAATYCSPLHWAPGQHQVDVLTHGATYNGSYWNWPQDPSLYSYVAKTLQAGRATLDYDSIGAGQSTRPVNSTDVTMTSDAYILHQIIQDLHLIGYKQVNSIGHSMGSGVAMREAATYGDVSRVVLTGYLHAARNPIMGAALYPANLDPLFAKKNLDSGYLTTTPTGRQASFYSSSADPAVVAYDNKYKDIVSATFFGGYIADRAVPAGSNLSNTIKVPVLLIDGQQDAVFCFTPDGLDCTNQAGVQANETPYYTGAKNLTVRTVPNTGHDLALHPSANQSFATINQWITTH
jgi:pimeloyl-ACP methyl ester carboxylesterase